MPVVLPRPAFIAAVAERIAWLAENRNEDHLDNFLASLAYVRDRIALNPEAGPPLKRDRAHILRMRLFPRPLPYLVFYAHPTTYPIAEIYLVRLFGSGQNRAELDMSDWPW